MKEKRFLGKGDTTRFAWERGQGQGQMKIQMKIQIQISSYAELQWRVGLQQVRKKERKKQGN